jgi:hypothetical protein
VRSGRAKRADAAEQALEASAHGTRAAAAAGAPGGLASGGLASGPRLAAGGEVVVLRAALLSMDLNSRRMKQSGPQESDLTAL